MMRLLKQLFFFSLFFLGMAEAKIREPSLPYITGDGFRDYADYILDEDICNIDIDKLKDWDVIFVKTEFLNISSYPHRPLDRP